MTSPPPPSARGTGGLRLTVRLLAALLTALLLLLGPAASRAVAHAQLLRTSPADGAVLTTSPAVVELEFSEPVGLIDGAIRLFSAGAEPVPLEAVSRDRVVTVSLPDRLADGVHAVSYRVVSADGHPIAGALAFRIGIGDPPATERPEVQSTPAATEAMVVMLTGLHYLGLLFFTGLLLFHRVVLRPRQEVPSRPLRWSLGVTLAGCVLLIPAGAVRVVGGQPWELLWPPAWLDGLGWQSVAAATLTGVAGIAAWWTARRPTGAAVLSVPLGILALAGPLLVGHTQTTPPSWLMLTADFGHLLAASFWLGGLYGLGRQLRHLRRQPQPPDHSTLRQASATVSRFSGFALASVGVLAVSGLLMATRIVGSLEAIPGTSYGRTLLLKLGIVAPVLALAAWNRLVLLPRITGDPTGDRHWEQLTRTLRNEAALLIAVVAVTGLLTNTSPGHTQHHPSSGASQPAEIPVHATSQGLEVLGSLTPGTTGMNQLSFSLSYRGQPLSTDQVSVAAWLPSEELGPFQVTPDLDERTGIHRATLTLPATGRWQLQISARVDTFTKPLVLIELRIDQEGKR